MAECHLKQLHVCVRVCVLKCLCVKERERHQDRIKRVTGKRKYIVGKRRESMESSCLNPSHNKCFAFVERHTIVVVQLSVCLHLEGNVVDGKVDMICCYCLLSGALPPPPLPAVTLLLSILPSSCLFSLLVMRSHETESNG